MTVSKAQKVATAKYEAKAYDKVLVRLPRGKKKRNRSSGKAEGAERKRFHKRGHRRKATAGQHNRIAKRPGRSDPVSFSPHNFAQSDKKMVLARFTVLLLCDTMWIVEKVCRETRHPMNTQKRKGRIYGSIRCKEKGECKMG